MQIPFLSILIFLPLVAGITAAAIPAGKRNLIRGHGFGCCIDHLRLIAVSIPQLRQSSRRLSIHRTNGLAAGPGHLVLIWGGWHQRGDGADGGAGGVERRDGLMERGRPPA